LQDITEPVLTPIRRVLPPVGGIDFSPLLAMVLLQVVGSVLANLVSSAT
jgi:YggT family protein